MAWRAGRLLVVFIAGYLLIEIGLRLYIFGPPSWQRFCYGFTEGGVLTPAQAMRQTIDQNFLKPWYEIQFYVPPAAVPSLPTRINWIKIFRTLEWRLQSPNAEIAREALEEAFHADAKTKARLTRYLAKSLSRKNRQRFNRDLELLLLLGTLKDARPALPVLYEELEALRELQIYWMGPRCGTPPRPEYDSYELAQAAKVIRAIVMIDLNEKAVVRTKLRELAKRNSSLSFFCEKEIQKLVTL